MQIPNDQGSVANGFYMSLAQIVIDYDAVAVGSQFPNRMAADIAGTSCYKNIHKY